MQILRYHSTFSLKTTSGTEPVFIDVCLRDDEDIDDVLVRGNKNKLWKKVEKIDAPVDHTCVRCKRK